MFTSQNSYYVDPTVLSLFLNNQKGTQISSIGCPILSHHIHELQNYTKIIHSTTSEANLITWNCLNRKECVYIFQNVIIIANITVIIHTLWTFVHENPPPHTHTKWRTIHICYVSTVYNLQIKGKIKRAFF